MNISRTLDVQQATYDLTGLTDEQFTYLFRGYEYYRYILRHCPPKKEDELYEKMKKMFESKVTIF